MDELLPTLREITIRYCLYSRDLEKAHVVVVLSVKKENLEVAVHVRAVAVPLAIHLVAFPRLLAVKMVNTVVGAQTHCCTHTHITHNAVLQRVLNITRIHLGI